MSVLFGLVHVMINSDISPRGITLGLKCFSTVGGARRTVSVSIASVPAETLVEVTGPVWFSKVPPCVDLTVTLTKQLLLTGIVPPDKATNVPPSVAVRVPPQVVELGVALTRFVG